VFLLLFLVFVGCDFRLGFDDLPLFGPGFRDVIRLVLLLIAFNPFFNLPLLILFKNAALAFPFNLAIMFSRCYAPES